MKCDCCQKETELHPFYYDFFKVEYDENKWAYLCDDCRRSFLKYSSLYNPYIERQKKPLENMYELIDLSVEIRKEEEEKEAKYLLTELDLSKHKVNFDEDSVEAYDNLQKLVTIISTRAQSMLKKKISECKIQEFKDKISDVLLKVLNDKRFHLSKIQTIKLNILLNKKIKEFQNQQEITVDENLTYELAQNYLHRSNNKPTKEGKERTIQALMEQSYNESYFYDQTPESNKKTINILNGLEDFEKEFIKLRFGFEDEPMELSEMQEQYYPELTLEQLQWIENELLLQLKENIGVVKKRKKRKLYK